MKLIEAQRIGEIVATATVVVVALLYWFRSIKLLIRLRVLRHTILIQWYGKRASLLPCIALLAAGCFGRVLLPTPPLGSNGWPPFGWWFAAPTTIFVAICLIIYVLGAIGWRGLTTAFSPFEDRSPLATVSNQRVYDTGGFAEIDEIDAALRGSTGQTQMFDD